MNKQGINSISIKDFKGKSIKYDYKHQAWVIDGVYSACNHPKDMNCNCYGTEHAGETPEDLKAVH